MLVTLQFPIADARPFDANPNLRLRIPDWPDPSTGRKRQFVNRFGPAVDRRQDPDLSYPDEAKFCLARRAVRFEEVWEGKKSAGNFLAVDCAFRRLFCDGSVVVRTEIGFRMKRGWPRPEANWGADDHLQLVARICSLRTFVGDEQTARPMIRQGDALARLFARATTPGRYGGPLTRAIDLVEAGDPLIIVEPTSQPTPFDCPKGFTRVAAEKVGGAALDFGRLRTPQGPVPIWLLQAGGDSGRGRLLRLCLLRLHAEQMALDITLKQVKRGRIPNIDGVAADSFPVVADELDRYFNDRTRLLKREAWHGLSQSAVLEAFDAAQSVTRVASQLTRADMYQGARRQVWTKLEDYAARRAAIRQVEVINVEKGGILVNKQTVTNVSGSNNIVNVAEYMSNVRNEINGNLAKSDASDEIKKLLLQLTHQIEEIGTTLSPEALQQMSGDVKTLSQEVASPTPRRKWYELSLDGLKEAAEAAGAIATPIVATVKALIPLLLGVA